MTLIELKERSISLRSQIETLIANGESEKRELAQNEMDEMVSLRSQLDETESEIRSLEAEAAKLSESKNKTQTTMKEVRLFDLIKGVAEGNVTDEQRAYVEGNKINLRNINVSNATQGQENVPEDLQALDVAIRNATIVNKLGATWFGNAVGDITIPHYAGAQVSWKAENAAADTSVGAFSEITLKPHRLTGYIDISKTFLAQDANNAEGIIINDLASAIAEKLDQTIFSTGVSVANTPDGIMQGSHMIDASTTSVSSITFDDVLELEKAIEEVNGTSSEFTFVTDPAVKYALRGTQLGTGLGFVYSGNEIDGYKTIVSNSMVDNGLLCICPKDLAVATWSGVELIVDPYTRALYNEIRVYVNYLVDFKLRGNRLAGKIFAQ